MFYKSVIRRLLFLFQPEFIHHFLFTIFRYLPFIGKLFSVPLKNGLKNNPGGLEVFGLHFAHPVGLAGGMDKDAIALGFLKNLGFSFIEVGTVTPLGQKGNPKPRLFRLPRNEALVNRMGFNNAGVKEMAKRLSKRPKGVIIGGNIGKNTLTSNDHAWQDYVTCFNDLYPFVDYFVVNVSCPNIKDLSKLQNRDYLGGILGRLVAIRLGKQPYRPILLKISPDLSWVQLDEVVEVAKLTGIDGLVASNTSIRRFGLDYTEEEIAKYGDGGLSGGPLRERSSQIIRYLYEKLGDEFPIIASGGIMNEQDAMEKIASGAKLVQVYTGFVYEGPGLISRMVKSYWRSLGKILLET